MPRPAFKSFSAACLQAEVTGPGLAVFYHKSYYYFCRQALVPPETKVLYTTQPKEKRRRHSYTTVRWNEARNRLIETEERDD